MADVIEHISDDATAIQEAARVLRPGGVLVLTTLLEDRPSYVKRMSFSDHVREYKAEGLLALLEDTGLVTKRVFNFYYAPTLITRELQVVLGRTFLGKPGVDLLSGILFRGIGSLESFLPVGRPAGIGLIAVKPHP